MIYIMFEICWQGDIESICNYTLRSLDSMDEVVFSTHSKNKDNIITYKLPANTKFSIFFEVITEAGTMNVSFDSFSKHQNIMFSLGKL